MFTDNLYHPSQALSLAKDRETSRTAVLKLGGQLYGLQLESVVEIIRMVAITPVPEAGHSIEGVINLRGEIIPVIDLRRCLGLEVKPYTLNTHIVIAQTEGRSLGLLVDWVSKVADIPQNNVRPSNQLAPASKYVLGVAKTDDGLLLILDIASIQKQLTGNLPETVCSQPSRRRVSAVPELVAR